MLLVLGTFVLLLGLTITQATSATLLRTKVRTEWLLDLSGLVVQGIGVPLLQVTLVRGLGRWWLPELEGSVSLPPAIAFLLSFVLVDYLYYWNHRLLHSRWLWPLHQVHHSVTQMDVLGSSRNTLWSSLLILYLWVNGLALYLLANPVAYLLGVSLTAALDLWRHSCLTPAPPSPLYRWLSPWLILPQDHARHHGSLSAPANYGANLKLWDQWHGTWQPGDRQPQPLGIAVELSLAQQLLWPFRSQPTHDPAQ